jgi:hypothetical protein
MILPYILVARGKYVLSFACLLLYPLVDLRFTRPFEDGHFGYRYVVAEIIFTIVKLFFQTIFEK